MFLELCFNEAVYKSRLLKLPFCAANKVMLMQTGWIQASHRVKSTAGLRFNLFDSQTINPHQTQIDFKGFGQQMTY